MRCIICNRESDTKLCRYHTKAYELLRENYEVWKEAYKDLTWKEYLEKLLELEDTGGWVKDIIKYELEGLFKDS